MSSFRSTESLRRATWSWWFLLFEVDIRKLGRASVVSNEQVQLFERAQERRTRESSLYDECHSWSQSVRKVIKNYVRYKWARLKRSRGGREVPPEHQQLRKKGRGGRQVEAEENRQIRREAAGFNSLPKTPYRITFQLGRILPHGNPQRILSTLC